MNTSYIYSAARAQTLATNLLQVADVDRLLAADTDADVRAALQESYIGQYVQTESDFESALQARELAAKQLVVSIAPDASIFAPLWWRYDFHNIRTFVKARMLKFDYEQTLAHFSNLGMYPAETLYTNALSDTLRRLETQLELAYHQALSYAEAKEIDKLDHAVDKQYWSLLASRVRTSTNQFMRGFIRLQIDLHNAITRLRCQQIDMFDYDRLFVSGGSYEKTTFSSVEAALAVLLELGGEQVWRSAIENYQATGHFTQIHVAEQMTMVARAKKASSDMFSEASLVAYILQVQEGSSVLRTVVEGKRNGLSVEKIRSLLPYTYATHT